MTSILPTSNPNQRQMLIWVITALGIFWLALIRQLGAQWTIYEEYNYGWAVPFLCLYLAWQHVHVSDGRSRTKEFSPPSCALYVVLTFCALLYVPTRFFHEANPIWRLTSLLWALEVVGMTLIFLHLIPGTSRVKSSTFKIQYSPLIFPIGFFLVSVPWPSGLETFLVQKLTGLDIFATVGLLSMIGVPALQHGNVIEVATGMVGIDEACSGIRSFQATMMMGLFFGDLYRLQAMYRVATVVIGFGLAFTFNLMRTTLLTWVAAKQSPTAVASWHDPAGVTILLACFVSLWLVCLWLGKKRGYRSQEYARQPVSAIGDKNLEARPPAVVFLRIQAQFITVRRWAIVLLAWFILVELGMELWFRLHENSMLSQPWSVNLVAAGSGLTKGEVPAEISAQFRYDEGFQAAGNDASGNFWQAYYFRWLPSRSLKSRVASQLAKTHGPEKCLPRIGMPMKSDLGVITVSVGKRQFALRQYVFQAGDRDLYVFYGLYEDPTGSSVLANRRQRTTGRLAAALAGSRNIGQRFLEMAVVGPETSEAAQIALREEFKKLLVSP